MSDSVIFISWRWGVEVRERKMVPFEFLSNSITRRSVK